MPDEAMECLTKIRKRTDSSHLIVAAFENTMDPIDETGPESKVQKTGEPQSSVQAK